jgi:hypothetical protein
MSATSGEEMLEAVRDFLREELLPGLDGFQAYTTRVAANSLAIVARQLALAPELEALDRGIAAALDIDPLAGPVPQQIAVALRDGRLVPEPRLLDYLRQRTLKTLEIDNPRYSGYLLARERWSADI